MMRVLYSKGMKVKFLFELLEFVGFGIADRHPQNAVFALKIGTDFLACHIRDFFSVPVRDAVDDHLKISRRAS
jgi:hypothetical protein